MSKAGDKLTQRFHSMLAFHVPIYSTTTCACFYTVRHMSCRCQHGIAIIP